MSRYIVIIEETVSKRFTVEADDAQDALSIAREKYRNGDLVLDPGELESVQMAVVDDAGEIGEWEGL